MLRDRLRRAVGRRVRGARRRLWKIPSPTFLVATAVSFTAVFGLATAVGAGTSPAPDLAVEEKGKFPATPRVVVASGTIAGVGDYELLHSRDYRGGMCVGLRLKQSTGPDKDVLSEGCGGPEYLNIGKVTAGDGSWTIINGQAPEKAKKVKVKKADGSTLEMPTIADGKGIDGRFVVQKIDGQLGEVEFEAVDPEGRDIASHKFR